ncbi:hypothetical protein [Nocardioides sp. AE5]|uniref:hypothetical protein n=1 Tax=Nocardioides sp. AE5 TaxID=2962573 RepID=UPI002881AEF7|nr:hypothetical protein [Nocardioides sp. AE5]MDT0201319.1 hypothetical protein [Nocardioides sp. AE5]
MFAMGGPVRRRARGILNALAIHRPPEVDRRLARMRTLVERADPSLFEAGDLTPHEFKVFSQNGEDGVIVEIFNRIGVTNRFFVEFGIQTGVEGNCVLLADVLGWSGLFIEADRDDFEHLQRKYDGTAVSTLHEFVTADRFDAILAAAGVPEEPDLLSIDIDGNDLYVWDALHQFRPRVVIVEYNSGVWVDAPVAQPHEPTRGWDGTGAYGANLAALEVVAARQGYRLAHTDLAGVNAFFVRDDLFPDLGVDRVPRRSQNYGLTGITRPPATPEGGWQRIGE